MNTAAEVEEFARRSSGEIEVFSPEEFRRWSARPRLSRTGPLFLTVAFMGLSATESSTLRTRRSFYGLDSEVIAGTVDLQPQHG